MRALSLMAVVLLACGGPSTPDGGSGGGSAGGGSAGGSSGGGAAGGGGSTGGGGGSTGGGTGGSTGGGGGSGGGTGGGAPLDAGTLALSQICTQYIDATCELYSRCGYTETKAGCLDLTTVKLNPFFAATCLVDELQSLDAGRLAYDGAAAAACVYRLRNTVPCSSNPGSSAQECNAVFQGRVANGAPCARSNECDPASYCDATLAMCPGTCKPRKPGGADAGSSEECASGYYLYDGRCRLYALTGLSCAPVGGSSQLQECRPNEATCNPQSMTCTAPRLQGYPCSSDGECAFPLRCNAGNCSLASGLGQTCSYGIFVAAGGRPAQACKLDLACSNGLALDGGVCRPLGATGASCFSPFECAGNGTCPGERFIAFPDGGFSFDAGRCTAPTPNGPCANSLDCDTATSWCRTDAGTCTARRPAGSMGACTSEEQCTPPDSCVAGTCRRPVCAP